MKSLKVFLLFLSMFFLPKLEAKTYALVIGINHYKDTTMNRWYNVADATAFRKYLVGIHKSKDSLDVIFLTDSFASYDRIKKSLSYLSKKTKKSDKFILFISTHGVSSGGSTSYDYGYNTYNSVDYHFIKNVFDSSIAKTKYIFLENCYAGHMIEKVFKKDSSNSNYFVFCSSKGDEFSWQSSWVGNGFFTQNLLDALTSNVADRNKDFKITIKELVDYVKSTTLKDTNGRQTPIVYGLFKDSSVIGRYR